MDESMIPSATPGCVTMQPDSIFSAAGQANAASMPARQASRNSNSSSRSSSRIVVAGSGTTNIAGSAVDPSMEPEAQATMFAPASDRSSPGLGDDGASPVLSLPTFSSLPPLTLSSVPSPTSFTDLSLDLWSPQGPSAQQSLPLDASLVTSLLDDKKLFDLPLYNGSDDDDGGDDGDGTQQRAAPPLQHQQQGHGSQQQQQQQQQQQESQMLEVPLIDMTQHQRPNHHPHQEVQHVQMHQVHQVRQEMARIDTRNHQHQQQDHTNQQQQQQQEAQMLEVTPIGMIQYQRPNHHPHQEAQQAQQVQVQQAQHVQQLLGHSGNGQHQQANHVHVHHHHVHHVHVQQDSVQHHQHHYQQQHQHHQQSVFQQGQERLLHDDGRPARKRAHLSLSFAQQVYLAQQQRQQQQQQQQHQQQLAVAAAQAYTAPAPPFQAVQPMLAQAATQAGQHGQRDQPSLPQQASLEQQQKRKRRLAKKKDTEQTRRDAIRAHVNELRRIVLPENASAILRWSYQAVVMTCAVYAFTKADPGFFELANMHRQRVRKELLTAAFVRQVLPECAHADACTTPSQRRLQALTGDNKRTEYEGIVYDRLAALVSPEENEHARILRAARDRITSDGCRLTEQELIEVAELLGERKQG